MQIPSFLHTAHDAIKFSKETDNYVASRKNNGTNVQHHRKDK